MTAKFNNLMILEKEINNDANIFGVTLDAGMEIL